MSIDILIYAVLAAILVWRLFSVLGQRNGEEQQRERPNPFTIVTDAEVKPPVGAAARPAPADDGPASLEGVLTRMARIDPGFSEVEFLAGARAAFAMIVDAFARGDSQTLAPLLAPAVEQSFNGEIDRRADIGEKHEVKIRRLNPPEILGARLEGSRAAITVRFVSEQLIRITGADGTVTELGGDKGQEVRDVWTFTRDLSASDPNWELAETSTEA